MEEIVEDGRTGLHFTAGDAGDLAAKVRWAWDHPDEMRTMGRNARLEYEAKYTAERNYEMLHDIYQRVLTKAGSVTVKFELPASVSLDVNSPPGPNRGVPVPSMLQERPRPES
jgi:hypothetical protein